MPWPARHLAHRRPRPTALGLGGPARCRPRSVVAPEPGRRAHRVSGHAPAGRRGRGHRRRTAPHRGTDRARCGLGAASERLNGSRLRRLAAQIPWTCGRRVLPRFRPVNLRPQPLTGQFRRRRKHMPTTHPVLDLPAHVQPDPDEFIQAAMEWHFGPETGSPFWLRRAKSLDFDPRKDVETHDDLRLFPNIVNELRDVPVTDLIPRGYGARPDIVGVFESGGTTGVPKRVVCLGDWLERFVHWCNANL